MNRELVALLRALLKNSLGTMFHEDPRSLHQAFYTLRERYGNDFAPLGELHFITAGAFPYSPDLTEAFDTLQMTGALFRENPHFERFGPSRYDDTADVAPQYKASLVGSDPALADRFDHLVQDFQELAAAH